MIVKGFKASGICSGIKRSKKKDLALIYSDTPAQVSGVFTTNVVKAAPVIIGQRKVRSGLCQALIINSGIANVCTGRQGITDANDITKSVAKELNIKDSLVIPSSTGLIGAFLTSHISSIKKSIPGLVKSLSENGIKDAAEAIMTTDAFVKTSSRKIRIDGREGTIAAIGKGAGMISPNMATMLGFAITDIELDKPAQDRALTSAVNSSFNKITVDGDTSTNDTVLLLSNGYLGNKPIKFNGRNYKKVEYELTEVLSDIAYKIVEDGEGATKVARITVKGTRTIKDADKIAHTIGTSTLVKTALYGQDPNWGRILGAAGRAGVKFNPDKLDLYFGDYQVCKNGMAVMNEKKVAKYLKQKDVEITLDLNSGKKRSFILSSDLTVDYVKFNSDYTT
ncbi:MAG: bifunctional glutamate N-acetyltransferase/amino-acid acetyltransferase ArgJ [Candidatus Dadabacteria bacterium]|nr:bifunctional glutamate N-acetyltransferase/amino-acid acetyltransferase ArgJ [Candidatus Dadabacteria bacterium]NIS09401.1 bifunctional glutamate N-acetyltransferase/amino-acid acetyltransferase ArgJ [Candidatus Dadabacteria bacterium]NIV42538.1 bifunctional glutamate N-acetyltransferase/amino-acid acetyltransferase ArgJ [Candidatus Dadabacteria bacterium]NIY22639.1 bifunctional glutamate N-acetyltransferase/amino-acid acetyltransferase ArgJ [Candidatus Dadabacteria bacterium]